MGSVETSIRMQDFQNANMTLAQCHVRHPSFLPAYILKLDVLIASGPSWDAIPPSLARLLSSYQQAYQQNGMLDNFGGLDPMDASWFQCWIHLCKDFQPVLAENELKTFFSVRTLISNLNLEKIRK